MKKFCCDTFYILYSTEKNRGLNIRIIKLTADFIKRAQLQYDKVFYITEGYMENIGGEEKRTVINFCPFCGKNLRKKYGKTDDYVQEIMDI